MRIRWESGLENSSPVGLGYFCLPSSLHWTFQGWVSLPSLPLFMETTPSIETHPLTQGSEDRRSGWQLDFSLSLADWDKPWSFSPRVLWQKLEKNRSIQAGILTLLLSPLTQMLLFLSEWQGLYCKVGVIFLNVAGRAHCQVMMTMMKIAMRKKKKMMMVVKMMGMTVLMKMKKTMVVR